MSEAEVKYIYPLDKIECQITKPDYSKMYFEFHFTDGETAKYRMDKDCHNLQQFLDRMNAFHELEKENKRLQAQLNEANKVISYVSRTSNYGPTYEPFYVYCQKWGVK